MAVTVSLSDNRLVALGRIDKREQALAFDWTNSGIYFRFRGNKVIFHFDIPALSQQLYLKIKLDGIASRVCVSGEQTTVEITANENGDHRVYMVRCNEILDAVPLVLNALEIDGEDAAILDAPVLPERRMMFIGDSITCGFGNLAAENLPRFTTNEQDGTKTYAALTAAHFQAQAHFVCISGRGIVRNCDNVAAPLIPEFFDQTTISDPTPWDHAQYQPDVIVVNAGTNDTAGEADPVDPAVFRDGVKAFAGHLLTVYPNAKLLWCYGMMSEDLREHIEQAIKELENPNIQHLFFKSIYAMEDEIGACNHPNLKAHYRCAGVLIQTLHEFVGWEK